MLRVLPLTWFMWTLMNGVFSIPYYCSSLVFISLTIVSTNLLFHFS
uniref:Uncharacterized protein n=1 Tax=Arundo donax TaxID=35708 RepID=A0A0A9F070_ARUDO